MRKITLTILIVLLSCTKLQAEEPKRDFQVTLYGGVYLNNETAWQIEPSFAWRIHKYIGAAIGIEFTSQYNEPSRMTKIDGHDAILADNDRNVHWAIFKVHPKNGVTDI